jgi:hypothetical protein
MPSKNRRVPGSTWGSTTEEVLRLLAELGPMTRAEICRQLGRNKEDIAAVVSRLNKPSAVKPKRIFVKGYVYDMEGERRYPRAVFELGDKPDKSRPKSNIKEIKARHWAKKKMQMKANSVFHLGMSRRQIKAMHKQIKEQTCTTCSE